MEESISTPGIMTIKTSETMQANKNPIKSAAIVLSSFAAVNIFFIPALMSNVQRGHFFAIQNPKPSSANKKFVIRTLITEIPEKRESNSNVKTIFANADKIKQIMKLMIFFDSTELAIKKEQASTRITEQHSNSIFSPLFCIKCIKIRGKKQE